MAGGKPVEPGAPRKKRARPSGDGGAKAGPKSGAAPKASAGPKKAAGPKKGGGRKGGRRGGTRRLLRDLGRWLALRLGALAVGALLGLAAVVGVLYRQALADVDALLEAPVWSESGRVLSGPIELWPGLVADRDEVAADLQRAGYARVPAAKQAGDFEVGEDRLKILAPAAEGPGWSVDKAEVVLTFADGRVALAGGKARVRLAPTELAGVRGPENEARRPVPLEEIPAHVVHAVLAMEDARFREHEGLDPLGIARALLVNAWSGQTVQGGSTLTQQLVKNLFLTQERSYERKAREALLAVALERRRSKDEILELYLNEIYLGQVGGASVCGLDQAARAYFGKPVQRLELGEAAALAGIISAPNRYSPLKHPEAALERRDLVLARMAEVGWLDPAQVQAERDRPLQVHALAAGRRAPWAVDAALGEVEEALGEGAVAARGLTVHTTINPALQRLAERAVAEAAAELDQAFPKAAGAELALVAVRVKDGAIVALVGGRDYAQSQFDRALVGRRQVGSTVKPLTWLFAFDSDPALSPATVVQDEPIERVVDGKRWSPGNYDGAWVGPISLREALVQSRNVPAVLLAERVGMRSLAARWKDAGLSTATDWPSAALGSFGATPVEVAGAYSAFPRGGSVVRPALVRGATDVGGAVLYEAPAAGSSRIAGAAATFLAADVMRQVITRGTGKKAGSYGVQGPVGGKTGTTDDGRDAWFAGFTDELAVVVWVGFDRDRALGLTGSQAALPAWARFVAASGTMDGRVTVPDGLAQVEVCASTGLPPCGDCEQTTTDWFQAGHAPDKDCGLGRLGLLDKLREQLRGGAGEEDPPATEEGEPSQEEGGKRRKHKR